ncbi:MAG: hypothetical protein PHO87_06180 [Acholeplasmataceae bacterium]|nr:hypothetical protein [Acholeplasmataceae bacterium]
MVSKNQMNIIIACLFLGLIIIGLAGSGYLITEKKYTLHGDPNVYITFNTKDHTFFYHGTGDRNYQGTYIETDTDYSVFFDDGSGMIYTKFENGSIAMISENAPVFEMVESTGLQKLGLN